MGAGGGAQRSFSLDFWHLDKGTSCNSFIPSFQALEYISEPKSLQLKLL